ncbi:MAG TPA: HAD family hydrolase, partial [Thermoplasmata archaeon]|nr:HAD family hydrolase [Thermoplasmata archaeon]
MKKGTQIRGIIFDLDGTLIDIHIPFEKIRKELNIPEGDILKKISLLPEDEQKRAYNLIDRLEYQAIPNSKSVCGAKEVIEYLNKNKIPYAVVTRGS